MKVSDIGAFGGEEDEEGGEEGKIKEGESRFYKLSEIDQIYENYVPPVYDDEITLPELCDRFRLFACSRRKLFYDIRIIRLFIAGMSTTRLMILQGISGTGKTSLAHCMGLFLNNPTTIASVQPSWRDRTELFGYFNEFTKRFNETEVLKKMYEATWNKNIYITVLDEMNIARVEYYFAEMLSILEMPLQEEWKIDITSAVWDNDPCLIDGGSVSIPNNVWFVGTINNDDSTFAVADKVYDRAIPIDLDSRAAAFDGEPTDAVHVSTDRLNELFAEAKKMYPVSQEILDKIDVVNDYVIKTFRLAFGNRIMKQIGDFVPCFIACGGTEIQAVDFMIAKKVLRKFESLSLGFMKDDLTKFSNFLDRTFGKNTMKICKDYIELLKKTN
jgi:5-methylcytosine-specific restriction endonuclease McrBC GTP-binding regulatory subunit McrB